MQKIQIDLKKNPEIADLVIDLQPGDKILLHTSINELDDQTLGLTIEEAEEDKSPEKEAPGGNEGAAAPGDTVEPPQAGATPDAARDITGNELAST